MGIMIFKDGKVLFGKRKNSHGAATYAPPGGSLEFMESFEDCARREVREETGIEIENIKFLCLSNQKIYDKHFVNLGFTADWKSGESQVMEPEKCEAWVWYDIDKLPQPLFPTVAYYLKALQTKEYYFDA